MDWIVRSSENLFDSQGSFGSQRESSPWDDVEEDERVRKFLMSQRFLSRNVIHVSSVDSIRDAEEARRATSKVYFLHRVKLESTKAVEVAEDRPFRMWFPEKTPEKLPSKKREKLTENTLSMCSEVAGRVEWDCVLPERDVVHEVKTREKRLRMDMLFGPALRLRLHHYLKRNHKVCKNGSYKVDNLDCFARAELDDGDSDVLRQCCVSVYYPDVNYERESSALRDVLVSKLYDRPLPSFEQRLEIAVPSSSYAISVNDGGLSEILWDEMSTSILINVAPNQDVREYARWYFRRSVDAVRLTTTERMTLSKYLDNVRSEKFDNAVRVFFNSIAECEEALEGKDHRVARLFPRAFIIGREDWNSPKNVTMTYRAKWFTSPSKRAGLVILKDSQDQVFAKSVLLYNGFSSELMYANDANNTAIVLGCIPECYQHDSVFENRIREVLEMNGIELQRAYLHRYSMERYDTNDLVRKLVSREILEYLIRRREWHDSAPVTFKDWDELLNGNRLPWTWQPLDVEDDEYGARVREAELAFKDVELGLRLLDMLTTDDLDLKFSIRNGPQQRIVMNPLYCVGVGVTKEVRVACDAFIRHLNDEESKAAERSGEPFSSLEIVDKTWTPSYYATDDCDTSEGELSVQGWPPERVEEVAMRLMSYFEGSYIDCSNEETGRLLYGYGANYVEFVRKKLRGTAVIDVDLVGERITLVGQEADVARRKLEFFARNPHAFSLKEQIKIAPPRYLHFMRNALVFVGIERLMAICGGAKLKFVDDKRIEFCGSLEQHELLMNYLEYVDGRLISSSSMVNTTSKPNCPICLSPVSDAFYCLECGHYYCLKCIVFQVKTQIRNRDFPLRCFNVDCGKLLAVTDLKYLLLGDARLPWLNARKVQCLLDSTIDCVLQKETSLRRCPTPDCYGLFKVATIEKNKVITCDSCKRTRCCTCMVEPHEGVSCEEYAVLRSDEAASLRAYLKKKEGRVRQCPTETCGAYIEKGEGCNHMHCSMCNIHFCWICGFRDESQSKVYGHLRDKHGAIGEEWPLFGNALVEPFRPRRFPERRLHFLPLDDDIDIDDNIMGPFVGLPF